MTEFRGFPPETRDERRAALGSELTVQESDWNCGEPDQPEPPEEAVHRTGGTVPGEFGGAGIQRDRRRPVSWLGMAHSVLPQHHPGRDRALYQARHPRNPDLFAAGCGKPSREGASA